VTDTAVDTPIPPRDIPVRRIDFDYPVEDLPRHFASGDLVHSHFIACLSALFPEGEDFFVRSVRHYRDQVTDPQLKKQVAAFIGQEAIHGREHREFNERLGDLGYPTRGIDRAVKRGLAFLARVAPAKRQLAVTAALEHYTATMAEVLLSDERAQNLTDVPQAKSIFLWHAVEESEHKSVAFDVFRAVGGSERLRIWVMRSTTVIFLTVMGVSMTISLAKDPASRDLRRLGRSLRAFRRTPFITKDVRRCIRDYNRRGFHPDDHDSSALLERWREELFGEDGELTEMLRRSQGRKAS
jgi:uncharacterized protein